MIVFDIFFIVFFGILLLSGITYFIGCVLGWIGNFFEFITDKIKRMNKVILVPYKPYYLEVIISLLRLFCLHFAQHKCCWDKVVNKDFSMKKNIAFHHRRSLRLKGYDYSQTGMGTFKREL